MGVKIKLRSNGIKKFLSGDRELGAILASEAMEVRAELQGQGITGDYPIEALSWNSTRQEQRIYIREMGNNTFDDIRAIVGD